MPNCSWKTFFGFGSLVAATAILIIALAGQGWRVYEYKRNDIDFAFHVGLKQYALVYGGVTETGTLKGKPNDFFKREDEAGSIPLGFGIVGLFLSVIGMLLICIQMFRPSNPSYRHFKRIGLIFNFISGFFALLSIILYARKFYVGYSFILYIFCAFLSYIGTTFLLSHAFTQGTSTGGKTLTTTTTTTATPAPASHEMGVYNENQA